nr:F-box only protein 27-like [Vicugna pacos]
MGDPSQLPPELLLAVLSHVPPRTLLGRWRPLVDAPAQWLKMLARDHYALWPVPQLPVPRGPRQSVSSAASARADRWYHKQQRVLDLEEEGFRPELLDSVKIEVCFSDWWTDQQDINTIYQLTIQLLDANQVVLGHFSSVPFPIQQGRKTVFYQVSHVFSNLKTGVCFVSLELWVHEKEFCSEHYGIYLPDSSVIVQGRLS